MSDPQVWFWQRIFSPHMAGLAEGLALTGFPVFYVAQQPLSADRIRQGWTAPEPDAVDLRLASSESQIAECLRHAPDDSIHICQGIRANGLVGFTQKLISRRGLSHWVVMETVDDHGWKGLVRRLLYRHAFARWRKSLAGVLAIGEATVPWVIERGVAARDVYPFAYFLPGPGSGVGVDRPESERRFRVLFVGQFIERKRLDLLIAALAGIGGDEFELAVIGSGPRERAYRRLADRRLPGRVHWIGRVPLTDVAGHMAAADCLVLPSRHDGWGAVAAEAMMAGTPAIVSDACGVRGAVKRLAGGSVFESGNVADLIGCLRRHAARGRIGADERTALAERAACLSGESGGRYLARILRNRDPARRPDAPWEGRPD